MSGEGGRQTTRRLGLAAAPVLALITYVALPDHFAGVDAAPVLLGHAGRVTAAVGVWMAVWWMTEAIPVYATALLPLALFSALGVSSMKEAAAPYGHELIFLFMGGFMIALSMERWGLHRRIAFAVLRLVGDRPTHVVGGFMLVSAGLSMWVSNTSTAVMMLPVATSVIGLVEPRDGGDATLRAEHRNFSLCLLLGVAYGASIGGMGTLIGTPPNLFLASFAKSELGTPISFVRWMGVAVPVVAIFLPLTWWLLTRVLYPIRSASLTTPTGALSEVFRGLGPMSRGERATLAVFVIAAGLWIGRPLLAAVSLGGVAPFAGLSDPGIAILAALALFVIPVGRGDGRFVMDWSTAVRLPWGVLLLFGGGLSLAAAIRVNGVGEFLGSQVTALGAMPTILFVTGAVTLMIFLTVLTSNTATTATLVPIFAAIAPRLGVDPLALLVPVAMAASCAFMLPVATPPNAIVFGSGRISVPEMSRAGFVLNGLAIALIVLGAYGVTVPLLLVAH